MSNNSSQGGYDPKALGGSLGNKLSSYVNSPAPHPGLGGTTVFGLQQVHDAAKNPAFSTGINNTMSEFGDIAAGKRFGMDDPGFAAVRQGVADDTVTGINSVFNSTGRFGAGSHQEALGEGLGRALGELDYGNFQNDQARQFGAADRLGGLLADSLRPGQAQLGIGAIQDQDNAARTNADFDRFAQLFGLASGAQGIPGMGVEIPPWERALGYATQLGGAALGGWARGGF